MTFIIVMVNVYHTLIFCHILRFFGFVRYHMNVKNSLVNNSGNQLLTGLKNHNSFKKEIKISG